jgi:hypothetical protein
MFLFYTLMCRNYQQYKWKLCWSQIGTFQKSVLELFSKMVTLRVEDGVKLKTLQLQSCQEFHGKCFGYKIRLIPITDDWYKPAPLRPKMGRRESERLYKERAIPSLRSVWWLSCWRAPVLSCRLLAGRAHLIFFSSAKPLRQAIVRFRFWEGSGYFRSSFFSGFLVFSLFFCRSDFTGF